MRWKEELIKDHEKLMDEDRLERARKKRDKAIRKMLAKNKLTNKELDIDLYSLPLVEDISEKEVVRKKLSKKIFRSIDILKNKLKEGELRLIKPKVYRKNKNFYKRFRNKKGEALRFIPKERKA